MLIVSTVYTVRDARNAIREGHWNVPTNAADRQHSNLNRTLKTRHHTQTSQQIPPKGRAGGDEISRMQACTPLCMVRPLRSHLTCRTQKCAGVFCWSMSSSLSEGLAAAAKFNSTRLISASVPCCLASCGGVVWCVVLQRSSSIGGSGSSSTSKDCQRLSRLQRPHSTSMPE